MITSINSNTEVIPFARFFQLPATEVDYKDNSTTFSRLFFSAWPGSGAPLSRDLEGALVYKF